MLGQFAHQAFLERLKLVAGDSPTFESLALAYRVLLLVDGRTVASAADQPAGDAADLLEVVCGSLADVATRSHLERLLDLCSRPRVSREKSSAISAVLLDWGETLRSQCYFDLALDVASTALDRSGNDLDVRWRAHRDCAWGLRILGRYEEAESHYEACVEVGEDAVNDEPVFRGRVGLAMIARCRGNLPYAESLAAEL